VKRGELSKRDQKAWKDELDGDNGNVVGKIGGALIGGLIGGVAGVADREYEDWRMRQNVEKAIRNSKR
jgi:hypothetical protein